MKKRAAGQPGTETARDGLPEILPPCDDRIFKLLLAGDIALAFVELPKAAGLVRKPAGEMTPLEQWAVFFGCAGWDLS
ncbi:MAG: hypothetical protein LBT74_00650 [Acidobacteriota bacterium]|jgi:hypothetical protein|nr:hypothetical protein [Acidobacteriota bacterium]